MKTQSNDRATTISRALRLFSAAATALILAACGGGGGGGSVLDDASSAPASAPAEQPLQISTEGSGTVVSDPNGISCGSKCEASYPTTTDVALTAVADQDYELDNWSASGVSCSRTNTCVVSMKVARTVHATFKRKTAPVTLTVRTVGSGSVTSSPSGIDCGSDCTASVTVGDQVTLNATAASGYAFAGWSGSGISCAGTGACGVTMSAARTVTATFTPVVTVTSYALDVSVAGSGTVSSSPAGINCSSGCSGSYTAGTAVTLTAAASTGYTFSGWNGTGISCGTATTCSVTMSQARSVTATFTQNAPTTYRLTVALLGQGTVTSSPSGISCGSTCDANFAASASVVLTATPASGYTFVGWSGSGISCSGTGTCTVSMTAARSVTATFSAVTVTNYTLTVTKSGTGTVTSSPTGISCGSTCSSSYASGTVVTLTAAAGSGSTFSGWSGACSGSATTCSVSLTQARSVTATFTTTSTGGSTSSGKVDWTRVETPAPWNYQSEVPSRSACATNEGTTYEVGPDKTYTRPSQVPWLKLVPCDQVLFYYSSTPYNDIVFLGSRGEKNKWITIKGVPGPNGELPTFDGNNAVMPTGTGANTYSDSAGLIEVVVPDSSIVSRASLYKPGYLHFTGLKFQNARPPAKVTNLAGKTAAWNEFSSGIYLVGTEHVVIDYCEFADNGLGVFANSGGGEYMQNYGLTISHNYFHGNGVANKASEHNAYTEGIGTIYEYNYFGAPVTNTGGDNIKDRSAGIIFRYNYIEDGADLIALRDPESNRDYEAAAVDSLGEVLVSKAFIYSNILVARNPTVYNEAPIIVAHGDGYDSSHVRYGELFFYNNRVISTLDYKAYSVTATPLFDLLNTRKSTTVVARNNLFYATNHTSSGTVTPFALFYWQGPADWQSNWINKFQNVYASAADGGLAAGTKFDGSGLGGLAVQSGDPGFVNFSTGNYLTTSASPYASLNAALPTAVTARGLTPASEPVTTPFGK